MPMPSRSVIRLLRPLVACVVAVTLGSSILAAHPARAQLVGCQSDPVLLLSNGTEIDLRASIDDSSDDVQQVSYTVHGPTGTSVVGETPGLLGPKEVVRYVADQDPGRYATTTVVDTGAGAVAVTATTQALGLVGVSLGSVSGVAHQPLTLTLTL